MSYTKVEHGQLYLVNGNEKVLLDKHYGKSDLERYANELLDDVNSRHMPQSSPVEVNEQVDIYGCLLCPKEHRRIDRDKVEYITEQPNKRSPWPWLICGVVLFILIVVNS